MPTRLASLAAEGFDRLEVPPNLFEEGLEHVALEGDVDVG